MLWCYCVVYVVCLLLVLGLISYLINLGDCLRLDFGLTVVSSCVVSLCILVGVFCFPV